MYSYQNQQQLKSPKNTYLWVNDPHLNLIFWTI